MLSKPADHYGLSLVLGGAEGTLWDITGMYASLARTLNNFFQHPGRDRYNINDFHPPLYIAKHANETDVLQNKSWLSAASIYHTVETLKEVYRPGEESGWRYFTNAKQIAWKTGTSFGFRDGWAIGITPGYAVGVWVGNADGEGRPGLTGTDAAAPLMFDVFSQLPESGWFRQPMVEMKKIITCKKSGYLFTDKCEEADTLWVYKDGKSTPPCTFHRLVHLTADVKFQLHSDCASLDNMKHVKWFVLPPVQEYYYRAKNIYYHTLPPFRADCQPVTNVAGMDMIYPKHQAKIFIPRDLDGNPGSSVFEVAHRNPNQTVFWHLDGKYLGSTKKIHHLAVNPAEGKHVLIVIDEKGELLERQFEVLSKM